MTVSSGALKQPRDHAEGMQRLPLPLAQLYHSAQHRPQKRTPLEVFLAASQLWEAALKLLAATSIVHYGRLVESGGLAHLDGAQDSARLAKIRTALGNLARPALGHWWNLARLSIPLLAETGDSGFQKLRDLLEEKQHDFPRAAALDVALQEAMRKRTLGARTTVRLSDLFDGLVWLRNRETGHGTPGKRPKEFYAQWSEKLLPAVVEVLARLDVLAGRRLVFITDVRRQPDGSFLIERYDVMGETGRMLEPVPWQGRDASQLPCPEHLYLHEQARDPAGLALTSLYPLLVFDSDEVEVLFVNEVGKRAVEYLGYRSGRTLDRQDATADMEKLLSVLMGGPVKERLDALAEKAEADAFRNIENALESVPENEPPPAKSRRLGDFELLSLLGEGGMGRVYRARQLPLGREIALKCCNAGGARDRFGREIRALGRVKHPHLVEIYASGCEGEQWFYAMELLEGTTLATLASIVKATAPAGSPVQPRTWEELVQAGCAKSRGAERNLSDAEGDGAARARATTPTLQPQATADQVLPILTPVEPPEAVPRPARGAEHILAGRISLDYIRHVVEMIAQAARAAHALHEHGVVHRDIKPGNIMITSDGNHAVLMDLGLAKLTEEDVTRTKDFLGTVPYASPEQVHSAKRTDRRADVYSLGATLWDLLTLRTLYRIDRDTPPYEAIHRILFQAPEPIRKYSSQVAPELEAIVAKCLEKNPEERYATALELAEDLERFLKGDPVLGIKKTVGGRVRHLGRKLRRRAKAAAGVAAFLGLIGLGMLAQKLFAPTPPRQASSDFLKIEHFTNFVMRRGVPEGIGPLKEDALGGRHNCFRFHVLSGRVYKVEVVNGKGKLTTRHDHSAFLRGEYGSFRECQYEYKYDEHGQVVNEIALDAAGAIVWKFTYTTSPTKGYYTDSEGNVRPRTRSGAAQIEFAWDDNGYLAGTRYFDVAGNPQPDQDAYFGERYERDAHGLLLVGSDIDRDGKPVLNKHGYAKWQYSYDDEGRVKEVQFLDAQGKPTWHKYGYGCRRMQYDPHGNEVSRSFWEPDGKEPAVHKDGYHEWRRQYDKYGMEIETAFFDAAGKPTLHKDGYQRATYVYDDNGRAMGGCFYNCSGQVTPHVEGYVRWTSKFDAHGNRTEWVALDENARPVPTKYGYAGWSAEFDDQGNQVKLSSLDEAGSLTLAASGYAYQQMSYDKRGNKIEMIFFDDKGRRCRTKDDGVSKANSQFDARGNIVAQRYFDERDRPCRCKKGYAKVTSTYDEYGRRTLEAFYDEFDGPTRTVYGAHRTGIQRDRRGNPIKVTTYDENERPILSTDNFAMTSKAYDDWGNVVEIAALDVHGNPRRKGLAKITYKYDRRGNIIEEAYFGFRGKPFAARGKVARVTVTRDARGNAVLEEFWGADGKRAADQDGHFQVAKKYDACSRAIQWDYLDARGGPAPVSHGFARATSAYNRLGQQIAYALFDAAGKPVRHRDYKFSSWKADYDRRGHLVMTCFFDEAARPAPHADGYARLRYSYDARGNKTEESYQNAAGALCFIAKLGIARLTRAFDTAGNPLELAFWDQHGRLVRGKRGFAREVHLYNEQGKPVETRRLDENGNLVDAVDGYARSTTNYDAQGRLVELAYWDADGKPARNKYASPSISKETVIYDDSGTRKERSTWGHAASEGYFRMTQLFDRFGNIVEKRFYNQRAELVKSPGWGCAVIKAAFDDRRLCLSEEYYDPEEAPTLNRTGSARWTAKYDKHGNRVSIAYWGTTRKPLPPKDRDGYTRILTEYDDHNMRMRETFEGYDGTEGIDKKINRYDPQGNLLETGYLDGKDHPARHKTLHYATVRWQYYRNRRIDVQYLDEMGKSIPGQVVVKVVRSGGVAAKAGVKPGDIIEQYDGRPIHYSGKYYVLRASEKQDSPLRELHVIRSGKRVILHLPAYMWEDFELEDRATPPVLAVSPA
jgi:YD repeat-containing protein